MLLGYWVTELMVDGCLLIVVGIWNLVLVSIVSGFGFRV